jgi:hypothetical protein
MASERDQLQLIAAEFEARGFTVSQEVVLPDSSIRADIVAYIGRSIRDAPFFIIVELVNKSRAESEGLIRRAQSFTEYLRNRPQSRIEFRYLDTTDAEDRRRRRVDDVESIILDLGVRRRSLRRLEPTRVAEVALSEWWRLNRAVRALAFLQGMDTAEDVIDLLVALRERQVISPRRGSEQVFDQRMAIIREALLAGIDGQRVDHRIVKELRDIVDRVTKALPRPRPTAPPRLRGSR